jgi:hypothetical protein
VGTVLDCLRTTYATLDLDAFPRQIIAALRRVVSAPFGSYNEIERGAARIRYVVEPAAAKVPHLELAVREYQQEQPVVANYLRTGDGSPRKLTDFLTLQNLHRLGIYNENYRRAGVEYQMTFMVHSLQRQPAPTIAIALDRGRGEADFTEHDRFMLNLIRPHVMTAYANAETVAALRRTAPGGRRRHDGARSSSCAQAAGTSSRPAPRTGLASTSRIARLAAISFPASSKAGSGSNPCGWDVDRRSRRPPHHWCLRATTRV